MLLRMFNYTKRRNSTAVPGNDVQHTDVNVVLKSGDVSKHSPVLELQEPISRLWDYCYFDSSYYWVRDFEFNNYNRYTLKLELDVLGTYRDIIRNTPNFCERTSTRYNGNITDPMQHPDVRMYQLTNTVKFLDHRDPVGGTYLVNVSGRTGGVWWILDRNGMLQLWQILFAQNQSELWDQIRGLFSENQITNVIELAQYINDIVILPFDVLRGGGESEIYLGYFNTHVKGYVARDMCYSGTGQLDFLHPVNTEPGGPQFYQRNAPYCSYDIYVPCCGSYHVDSGLMSQIDYLNYAFWVDVLGNITIQFLIEDQTIIYGGGNCAYRIPSSQQIFNGTVTDLVGGVLGSISNPLAALGNLSKGIAELAPVAKQMIGGGGNASLWQDQYIHAMTHYYSPAAGFDYTRLGYPLYATIAPSTNGYYKFSNAKVVAGESWENEQIENYLNSGIYSE